MDNKRVVIVDDSPFTVEIIQEILVHHGFEVVGTAASLGEVKKVVAEVRPDLVTMDLAMPGTDGFECIRAIHEIDMDIKVIIISSMKYDEIVGEAIKLRVSSFIQKPIEEETLIAAIKGIKTADGLYDSFQDEYYEVFKDCLKDGLYKMTNSPLVHEQEYIWEEEFTSEGIVVTVGIIGKFPGKMFFNMSNQTAEAMTAAILKRSPRGYGDIANVLTEFANIVSGSACSILNSRQKEYNLRVAPPSMIVGKNMLMSPPDFVTHTAVSETSFGKVLLNIGFKRGN